MTHLAHLSAVTFDDGSVFDIDLHSDTDTLDEAAAFAALVLVTSGDLCITVYSPRRREWSVPGGFREPGESITACARRELAEETGLVLAEDELVPVGHETYRPVRVQGRWPQQGGTLVLFRAALAAPVALHASLDDARNPRWVTSEEFRALAGDRFWWPMIEAALE